MHIIYYLFIKIRVPNNIQLQQKKKKTVNKVFVEKLSKNKDLCSRYIFLTQFNK